MRLRSWLAACVVVAQACGTLGWAQAPSDTIVIDGSKDPGAFPAWKVAEVTLMQLSWFALAGSTPISTADTDLLKRATESFSEARQRKAERFAKGRKDGILSQPPAAIEKDERDIHLEYRYRVLEIFDRLCGELSPDAQIALRMSSEAAVASNTIYIRRDRLAFFREPR